MTKYLPKSDGIDHINIYSKARTNLGRKLSNFSKTPFSHSKYGDFESIEGFWYWLKTGEVYNEFRELSGFAAKRLGKEIESKNKDNDLCRLEKEVFKDEIKEAIRCKLRQNKDVLKELVKTEEPLTHYYWHGDIDNPKIIDKEKESKFMIEEIERIRDITKNWLKNKNKKNKP